MLKILSGILLFVKSLPDLISLLLSVRDAVKKLKDDAKERDKNEKDKS